jgi:hypothetical protein
VEVGGSRNLPIEKGMGPPIRSLPAFFPKLSGGCICLILLIPFPTLRKWGKNVEGAA